MQPRAALGPQTSSSSSGKQVVELNGYVIILVEGRDGKIKLYGSPADKDNLEVADEILDVNERKLEDLPRTEVIRHIHECIQSCMIKLRVKRRSDSRLAGELGNAVQDAFVIAVEQQARERLQRLSALKRVTPVDMSQLSIKLNQQNHTKGGQTTTQDLSFLKEASPIYVTSLTSNHITAGTSTLTTATASAATVSSATSASVSSQIVAPVNTSSIIADSYVISAPISASNINNNNTTTIDTTIQPIANQQQQQQQPLAVVGSPPLSSNSKPIGYQTTTAVVSSSNLSSAISLATNGPSSTADSKLLTSCAKRVDNNLSGDDKSSCHNQISNSNTNYSAVNNSISGSSAILPNIVPATGQSNTTITGISSVAVQKLPIITNVSGSDVINSVATHYTQPIVVGGSVSCSGNTDSSLTGSSVTNFKHQQASTNNQLCNYSSLSNNTSSINNNNNLLINNLCNNNNSNNISNCGAGNTLNSFNAYGTSNCDLLLANGHPPKRELSTLSEGDSEPLDDNNGTSLYDHQQQLSNSNSSISKGRTELLLGDQSLRQDTRQRRRSGSSIVVIDGEDLKPCLPDDYISSHHIHHQRSDSKDLDKEMLTMLSVNQDNGPHREMAVDVPDTFIARNKTPPRYPPPRPPVQVNSVSNGTKPQIGASVVQTIQASHVHQQQTHHQHHNTTHHHQQHINHHQQAFQQLQQHMNTTASAATLTTTATTTTPPHNQYLKKRGSGGSGGGGSSSHSGVSLELEPLNLFRKDSSTFDNCSKKSSSKEPSSFGSLCETSSCDFDSITFRNLQNNNNNNNNNNNSKGGGIDNNTSCGSLSTRSSSSGDIGPPEYDIRDARPHRELPVDVPDSFIEIIKVPPRYPPPPHLSSLSSSSNASSSNTATTATTNNISATTKRPPQIVKEVVKAKSSLSSSHGSIERQKPQPQVAIKRNDELNGSVKPVPPPRDHLRMEKDGRLVNRAPAPQVPDRKISPSITGTTNHQIAQIVEPTVEQMDSIKKYQIKVKVRKEQHSLTRSQAYCLKEQLRRRREEEERIAQQNEFLRASLRGSRKLQALQDGPLPQQQTPIDRTSIGVDNDAYTDDEEVEKIIGYGELVAALTRLQTQLSKNGMAALAGRVTAAQNLLLGPGMAHALAARTAVLQRRRPRTSNPVCSNAQQLSKDVVEILAQSNSTAAIELGNLLTTHEMEGLLHAHDRVASVTDRTPSIIGSHSASSTLSSQRIQPNPPSSHHLVNNNILKRPEAQLSTQFGVLSDGSQDHIRIIQIEKSSEPLGATVRNEGEAVVIGRIVRGGAAEKSGLLHEGDEILEVNGIEMRGKTVNDVCALLGAMTGTLTFLIVPAGTPPPGGGRDSAVLHVRAHFDYDPEDDLYIPCRELGISFQKGDVLHVISRDDPNWWQAYREGEEDQTLAGLIPSQSFQHQRETMKLAIAEEAGLARNRGKESSKGATLLCARKGRKKKKKASSEAGYPLYATTAPDEPDPEEILTYEEVALYYPRATHKRPIVLIGPPNIGRHELRQRLMADSDRFAAAVPHTSRPRRDGEVPGQDYHFITRAQFEADILARKFVEHGEYEKAYYGTSLEAIRTVVASGKICVLNLHPQSLKLLRASDLKPYVVLVAPPSLEKLRQKKLRNGEPFKEEELKEIIATARDMEARWGHLFDMIIINNDTERAYHQLLAEINSLEREPQWVPASWVHNNRDES